jgi:hypothetical protein
MNPILSKQNSKLGHVYNISLPPGETCMKDAPCFAKCYARKAWRLYSAVRKAWKHNLAAYEANGLAYFEYIAGVCNAKGIEYFRWHVAGDIPDQNYLTGMLMVAKAAPATKFLCFTKRLFAYNRAIKLDNLKIVYSMWPGLPVPVSDKKALAWVDVKQPAAQDDCVNMREYAKALDTVRKDAIKCSGTCDKCFMCWYLEPEMSVIMKEH